MATINMVTFFWLGVYFVHTPHQIIMYIILTLISGCICQIYYLLAFRGLCGVYPSAV